ncbi:MAG TPA: hypothetical protein VKZ41_14225 [Gemmatimonadales bacterium]|nr:hypothetical protein [Gemmatimonadales bacterium]
MATRSVVREGTIAGVLGALGVSVWFLIIDTVAGVPLLTPATLGEAFLSLFGAAQETDGKALYVGLYTIVHFAAFIALGIVAAAVVRLSEREPSVLAGALILFVAIQVMFYGISAMLANPRLIGALAWYQVGLANLVAAGLMGMYLWRRHPQLGTELRRALAGEE